MKEIDDMLKPVRENIFSDSFFEFYNQLDDKVKEKFDKGINAITYTSVLNTNLVKKLVGTVFYELRIPVGTNQYRTILFAADNDNLILSKRIWFLNGFIKKSTKDYKKQIKIAERILKNSELWIERNI